MDGEVFHWPSFDRPLIHGLLALVQAIGEAGNPSSSDHLLTMGSCPDPITRSESKVLEQLLLGSSNKAIAAALLLSPRTVESHIANLLAKTGCQSRTQLLLWALGRR